MFSCWSSKEEKPKPEMLLALNLNIAELFDIIHLKYQVLKPQ